MFKLSKKKKRQDSKGETARVVFLLTHNKKRGTVFQESKGDEKTAPFPKQVKTSSAGGRRGKEGAVRMKGLGEQSNQKKNS